VRQYNYRTNGISNFRTPYNTIKADGEELEPTPISTGKAGVLAKGGTESGAVPPDFDPELKEIAQAWPGLSKAVRAGILALVRTSAGDQ